MQSDQSLWYLSVFAHLFVTFRGMAILLGETTLSTLFFASILKRGFFKRKEFAHFGCRYFTFKIDPFLEGA